MSLPQPLYIYILYIYIEYIILTWFYIVQDQIMILVISFHLTSENAEYKRWVNVSLNSNNKTKLLFFNESLM